MEGINLLPEDLIQDILSFLPAAEAGRAAAVSKSWHNAWLTRPVLEFDCGSFKTAARFRRFVSKTMQRYKDSNRKIDRFTLRVFDKRLFAKFVAEAIELGATHLNLESDFVLPRKVLHSETLTGLYLCGCVIRCEKVNWGTLKTLALDDVTAAGDAINEIFSSCCSSLEKLKLVDHHNLSSLHRFPNLKVLLLEDIKIHSSFFEDFSSRFPSLKDLSLHSCVIYKPSIRISSPTVERVSLKGETTVRTTARLDFPRIRRLEFSVAGPKLQFDHVVEETFCNEWECHVRIHLDRCCGSDFLRKLRYFLIGLRWSRIYLELTANSKFKFDEVIEHGEFQALPKVTVESLTTVDVPSSCRLTFFEALYWVCDALKIEEVKKSK